MMKSTIHKLLYQVKAWKRQNPQKIRLLGTFGAISSSYYIYNLEKAPITGRIRFININQSQEEEISKDSFDEIFRANRHLIISPNHPISLRINSVVKKLAKNIETFIPGYKSNFSVYVINNPEPNAFVLPGGQIFVNTGLLSITNNDDGLATVLAHEISHKIARHGAEKMSTFQFFSLIVSAAQFIITGDFHNPLTNFMKNVLLDLPFSRKCEKEADYIGLLLMAKSCYNPDEAIIFWQKMSQLSNSKSQLTSFLSTHPSHSRRIDNIRSWLPEARILYLNSDCNGSLFTFFNSNNFKNN